MMDFKEKVISMMKREGKHRGDGSEFDPIEIEIGTEVESEHYSDKRMAREICLDHLAENPYYYTKILGRVEKEVKEIEKRVRAKFKKR